MEQRHGRKLATFTHCHVVATVNATVDATVDATVVATVVATVDASAQLCSILCSAVHFYILLALKVYISAFLPLLPS